MKTLSLLATVLALVVAACVDHDDGVDFDATAQPVLSGWTAFTSEEYAPIVCDGQSLPSRFEITGPYSDNIRMYCETDSRIVRGDSYWTPFISEEYNGMIQCGPQYWMTGLACQGRYCDNVSIQCSKILYSYPLWVSGSFWVSEEQRNLSFLAGKYPLGVQCRGSYCDDMRFANGYLDVRLPDLSDRVK